MDAMFATMMSEKVSPPPYLPPHEAAAGGLSATERAGTQSQPASQPTSQPAKPTHARQP